MSSDPPRPPLVSKRKLKRSYQRAKLPLLVGLVALVAVVIYSLFFASSSVFQFVFSGTNSLKQSDGLVNVLLLGNGGGNHDGAELTDSMIVASYNLKTHNVALFSVPRDVWLPNINEKANAAYEKGGLKFAEDKVDDILGITIDYGVRLDFSGFSKAIDEVGGVEVNVPNSFDDYEYPIDGRENDLCGLTEAEKDITPEMAQALGLPPGKQKVLIDQSGQIATSSANFACRFEHIHFDKGLTHMNGTVALKFVRSRHALGDEGSDFARSKRQQLVLSAFREKVLSLQTLSNPAKVAGLVSDFGNSFETDIPANQFLTFYNLSKDVRNTKNVVLGDLGGGKSLFINPPPSDYGGAWVLIPPGGDFKLVSDFVKKTLADQAVASQKK